MCLSKEGVVFTTTRVEKKFKVFHSSPKGPCGLWFLSRDDLKVYMVSIDELVEYPYKHGILYQSIHDFECGLGFCGFNRLDDAEEYKKEVEKSFRTKAKIKWVFSVYSIYLPQGTQYQKGRMILNPGMNKVGIRLNQFFLGEKMSAR